MIDKIVIHCADTPADMEIGRDEIDQWHRERGWDGIGYHWVIRRNGYLERGRPESKQGAHVRGHNRNSIGVCLVGGKDGFNFTRGQMASLDRLCTDLLDRHPGAKILGHRDLDGSKRCPSFDVVAWRG